ncbi:hypothetical protein Ae201684P_021953 [Aphanomyces euteiches]|nr:hypothetical protein Ae201684P_021953 [Aphanomyces euteiches]
MLLRCSSPAPDQPPSLDAFIEVYLLFTKQGKAKEQLEFLYKWLVTATNSTTATLSLENVKLLLRTHGPNDEMFDAHVKDIMGSSEVLTQADFLDYMMTKRPIEGIESRLSLTKT